MTDIHLAYIGDMLFEVRIGNHRMLIDVPAGMGGNDRDLMPLQLF